MAEIADFVEAPSEEFLDKCAKEELLRIAEHYEIEISGNRLKDTKKYLANWCEMGFLALSGENPSDSVKSAGLSPPVVANSNLIFEH